jgi:hypothetical protein
MVEHPSCGYQPLRLRVFTPLGNQHLSVLVVGFFAVVAEEIDAGGKEVDGRGLEELVTATAAFLLSLLQGSSRVPAARSPRKVLMNFNGWVHPSQYSTSTS